MGQLFIISGPSGVGKGTVIASLLKRHRDLHLAISATTRSPREGEVDGKNYHFLSEQAFQDAIQRNGFLEYCKVHQAYYGTLYSEIEKKGNQNVLLEIDVQGAKKVKKIIPDVTTIFLLPPSIQELERRLTERQSEKPDIIQKRLLIAKSEIAEAGNYDYQIVNDTLENTVKSIEEIMEHMLC